MYNITGRNVNETLPIMLMCFTSQNSSMLIESTPRGERRLQYRMPIATTYTNPCERVLFDALRDANPFFHFMESLWIIAGRDDVAWLSQWLKAISKFSDDGVSFHGAYGRRIHAGRQLDNVIKRLQTEKDTTRAVLQIYDITQGDSSYTGHDLPCNCTVFLGIQNNKLNLTVANRSNDMILGAYGANVVQFSMLQEYIAGRVGCGVGWYCQFSNNAHVYPDHEAAKRLMASPRRFFADPYDRLEVEPYPMGADDPRWMTDLAYFMEDRPDKCETLFFKDVAIPMRIAHIAYRVKDFHHAYGYAHHIRAKDWKKACLEWLARRQEFQS